jgi:alpha-galactosidase
VKHPRPHLRWLIIAAALFSLLTRAAAPQTGQPLLAETPPMGWNSWDSYGTTIKEADFKANAEWLASHLKSFGWQYAVVDMEWFVTNPTPEGNSKTSQYSLDDHGRYIPPVSRFPSAANGAGFKPLSDYTHSLGLKFGIHILRGIPKQAVDKNLPIEGSAFHAADGAVTSDLCPWNPDNYGTDPSNPAAQAYYESIARLYAGWGVDLIKVDCIASRPYKGDDIRMLSLALRKTGRPIILSLSPGAAPIEKVDEMRAYAQMWRISDDIWDLWHSTVEYPQGVGDQFPRIAKWTPLCELSIPLEPMVGGSLPAPLHTSGHWPDADMLPLGYLGPTPGWGKARQTRLTHDEQRTLLTLWSIFRSPLMMGGNLTAMDDWTTSLLTNSEVITVDQHSFRVRREIVTGKTGVWTSQGSGNLRYVAIFNVSEAPESLSYSWKDLGFVAPKYKVRDLWEHKDLGAAAAITATVPSHGVVLYGIVPVPGAEGLTR